ncbi:MAG: hypothetical protein J2P14_03210 [Acidothermales bacterium]|nr:hypothetical protein [Acidothermales bacterium]
MNVSSLPLAIPRRTLSLFGRFWLPLVSWYLVGRGLHDGLSELASHVNRSIPVAGFSILAVAILCSLTATALMFLSIQPGLPTVWAVRREEVQTDPTLGVRDPHRHTVKEISRSVAQALMPFLLVYAAWNLFMDDVRDMTYESFAIDMGKAGASLPAFTNWFAVAAVVAFGLRFLFESISKRTGNPVTWIFAAVFEANWTFFVIYGIQQVFGNILDWFFGTLAWYNIKDAVSAVKGLFPVLPFHPGQDSSVVGDWFRGSVVPALGDGLVLPIAWLGITGVVYGRELEEVRWVLTGRARVLHERMTSRAPDRLRRYLAKFPPPSFKERYYPPFQAIWMMIGAGVPALLLFCVYYDALALGVDILKQVLTAIIGPRDPGLFWQEMAGPVDVVVQAIGEPLRICLLAATFDFSLSVLLRKRRDEERAGAPAPARETAPVSATS